MKTPISYYGGKQSMLKHILPLIPKHNLYTEAFCGGAAVFFAKQPSEIEVINDVNGNLINFYKVARSDFEALQKKVKESLHSRRQHHYARIVYDYPEYFDRVTRAWAVWLLAKESFSSKLDGTWGYDKKSNSMPQKLTNAKEAFTEALCQRLDRVQVECTDALRIIKSRDKPEAFHFVDPPYVNSDCGHYKGYVHANFEELLETLENIDGKFLLTMYPHELLDEKAKVNGWRVEIVERVISASRVSRKKKKEVIVMNY